MIHPLFALIIWIIDLYVLVLIIHVVLSLLIQFDVVNPYNKVVRFLSDALRALTEPVLKPIRQWQMRKFRTPFDFSPLIVLIGLQFIRYTIIYYLVH